MVRIGFHNHRDSRKSRREGSAQKWRMDVKGVVIGSDISNSDSICDGHSSEFESGDIHVQHALCMQHTIQNQTPIHTRHEQKRHRQSEIRYGMDDELRILP